MIRDFQKESPDDVEKMIVEYESDRPRRIWDWHDRLSIASMRWLWTRPTLLPAVVIGIAIACFGLLPTLGGAGNLSELTAKPSILYVVQVATDVFLQDAGDVFDVRLTSTRPVDLQAKAYSVFVRYTFVGSLLFYAFAFRRHLHLMSRAPSRGGSETNLSRSE
jgi:hypothetical protein